MAQVTELQRFRHHSLTSGLVKYEAGLHSKQFLKFVSIYVCAWKGTYAGRLNPDNTRVYVAHGGTSPVCGGGVAGCCRGRPSMDKP